MADMVDMGDMHRVGKTPGVVLFGWKMVSSI